MMCWRFVEKAIMMWKFWADVYKNSQLGKTDCCVKHFYRLDIVTYNVRLLVKQSWCCPMNNFSFVDILPTTIAAKLLQIREVHSRYEIHYDRRACKKRSKILFLTFFAGGIWSQSRAFQWPSTTGSAPICQKYEYLGEVLQQVDHWSRKISEARKCESSVLLEPLNRRHLAVNLSNFPSAEKLSWYLE